MNIVTHSAAFNIGSNPETEKQAFFAKQLIERAKKKWNDLRAYCSKRADGTHTSIGTQLYGTSKRKNDNAAFALLGKNEILTMLVMGEPVISWANTKEALKSFSLKFGYTPPVSDTNENKAVIWNTSYLNKSFTEEATYVSEEVADEILKDNIANHSTIMSVANRTFCGPLPKPEHEILNAHLSGELSKENLILQLREQGGYMGGLTLEEVKVSQELINSFTKNSKNPNGSRTMIKGFKYATEVHTFDKPLDEPQPTLKPVLAFIPPAPTPTI